MCINAKLCLIATIDKSLQRKTHNLGSNPAPATIFRERQISETWYAFFALGSAKIPVTYMCQYCDGPICGEVRNDRQFFYVA